MVCAVSWSWRRILWRELIVGVFIPLLNNVSLGRVVKCDVIEHAKFK